MTSCLQCGHKDPAEFLYCPRCGTKTVESTSVSDPLLGRVLNGKYRIEHEIGAGAMGTVYLGEHIGLKKKIALKVLHSDLLVSDESLQRFQREGIAAGKFNHPHAIQIFDFDKEEGRVFYLAMEYVEGVNLTLFMRQRGRLPAQTAVRLAHQMLSCLAEAHRHGIVHRDLKPDNIMVSESSRGELRLKVLDFGLSKLVDRRLNASLVTAPGRLMGTPLYMAPEQVAGDEADERSDVYAAGLILYEMLAGERPFKEKDSAQLFVTRPTAEAPSLRANMPDLVVPDTLEELLLRALARAREERYQTAEEMLNALDEVELAISGAASGLQRRPAGERRSTESSSVARTKVLESPPPAATAARTGRKFPSMRWLVGTIVGLLVVFPLFLFMRGGGESSGPARVRMVDLSDRSEQQMRYVALLDEARIELLGSNPQAALTAVNQAFQLDCRDAEAFLVRAEISRARGDVDSALADYRASAQGDPDYALPLLGLGWIQIERGELEAAEESFERAGAIEPDNASVIAARGVLEWKRGQPEAARTLLDEAVASDPDCTEAQLYLGRLRLDAEDGPGAVAALVAAKRNDPFSTRALVWLAEAYVLQDDFDKADVQLEDALRLEPLSGEVRAQRGALMLARGRSAEALDFLTSSTEKVPQEGRLWVLRGIAAYEGGDVPAACDALERGFQQGARDPDARCLLGALYQQQGELDDALAQYEAVLSEEGEYPLANLNLGLIFFSQEKYMQAATKLERVLAFDHENGPANLFLGQLYMDYLGEDARAIECLQRYVDTGGDDPRVSDWLDELR